MSPRWRIAQMIRGRCSVPSGRRGAIRSSSAAPMSASSSSFHAVIEHPPSRRRQAVSPRSLGIAPSQTSASSDTVMSTTPSMTARGPPVSPRRSNGTPRVAARPRSEPSRSGATDTTTRDADSLNSSDVWGEVSGQRDREPVPSDDRALRQRDGQAAVGAVVRAREQVGRRGLLQQVAAAALDREVERRRLARHRGRAGAPRTPIHPARRRTPRAGRRRERATGNAQGSRRR